MKDFLSQLSSYNLFNYLLPGAVFVFALNQFGGVNLTAPNVVVEAFVYYFVGMTISRIGSIFVEPVFQKLDIVDYTPYAKYVTASKADDTIPILLEQNNVYRTVIALIISVISFLGALWIGDTLGVPYGVLVALLVLFLLVLYGASYRKQTNYIKKRVEQANNSSTT